MDEQTKLQFIAESASEIVEHTDTSVCLILTVDQEGYISILGANNSRKMDTLTKNLHQVITRAIFGALGIDDKPKSVHWFSKAKRNVH